MDMVAYVIPVMYTFVIHLSATDGAGEQALWSFPKKIIRSRALDTQYRRPSYLQPLIAPNSSPSHLKYVAPLHTCLYESRLPSKTSLCARRPAITAAESPLLTRLLGPPWPSSSTGPTLPGRGVHLGLGHGAPELQARGG